MSQPGLAGQNEIPPSTCFQLGFCLDCMITPKGEGRSEPFRSVRVDFPRAGSFMLKGSLCHHGKEESWLRRLRARGFPLFEFTCGGYLPLNE